MFITILIVWVWRSEGSLKEKTVYCIIFPVLFNLCLWIFAWLGLGVINTVVFYITAFFVMLVSPLESSIQFNEIFVNPWIEWMGIRIYRIMNPPV